LKNAKTFLKKSEVSDEDLNSILHLESYDKSNYVTHGKGVIKKITEGEDVESGIKKIEEFEVMWRKHFVEVMNCGEFLDVNWNVLRSSLKK
jgi:hypothetical protein